MPVTETKQNNINLFFSDGLGFTGVYIAVDIGIKSHEENKTSVVDVFELSKNLRRDRHGIVSTFDHYNFTYQASYKWYSSFSLPKSETRESFFVLQRY